MKASFYNYRVPHGEKVIFFNGRTKTLFAVREQVADKFSMILDNPDLYDGTFHDFLTRMMDAGFVCNDDFDEYKAMMRSYKQTLWPTYYRLMLLPTYRCNQACWYCVQEHRHVDMTEETVRRLKKHVDRVLAEKNLNSFYLTWFGGEPLLATRQIESFSKKLFKAYQGNYSSDIITTGFPVSGSVVDTLRTGHINDIQITIDGDKENHNKVKFTNQCNDTFSRIIDNIDYISSQIPSINCIIRVNVTKENINDIPFLHSKLSARFANRNIWLSPSLVMQNGCACSEQLFSSDEFRIITKEWWEKYKIPTKWIYGIDRTECAIRKPSSIVVLPDGSICRCWEVTCDQEYTIGKLLSDGSITLTEANHEFSKNLGSIDPFSIEKCKKCPYLPICYGGCPIKIIKCENNHGSHVPICTSYKGHLNDWLELYLDYNQR